MKLYEINSSIESFWENAEETFGILQTPEQLDEIEKKLKGLEVEREAKAVAIACLIKNLDAEGEAIAVEELVFRNRRKSIERQAEWLRAYLAGNLEVGEKIKSSKVVISWRKSQSVQLLVAVENLPRQFIREKVIVEADKLAIKDAFDAGTADSLSGLAEVVIKNTIQIK